MYMPLSQLTTTAVRGVGGGRRRMLPIEVTTQALAESGDVRSVELRIGKT